MNNEVVTMSSLQDKVDAIKSWVKRIQPTTSGLGRADLLVLWEQERTRELPQAVLFERKPSALGTPQTWTAEHLKAYPRAALTILNSRLGPPAQTMTTTPQCTHPCALRTPSATTHQVGYHCPDCGAAWTKFPEAETRISNNTAAVDDGYRWRPMKTCPRGVKVQLLNEGGVAVYGVYNGEGGWLGWAPLPTGHPE